MKNNASNNTDAMLQVSMAEAGDAFFCLVVQFLCNTRFIFHLPFLWPTRLSGGSGGRWNLGWIGNSGSMAVRNIVRIPAKNIT